MPVSSPNVPCNGSSLCLLSVLDMEQVSRVPNHNYSDIVISSFPGAGDVWFSLRNTTYQNNSIVILEDIGEGDDALLCITNLTACYQPNVNDTGKVVPASGNWYFPNGTRVPSNKVNCTSGEEWEFYSNRGQMVVRMYRRRGGVEGIYCCVIPVAMNVIQTIYIGVYSASTGEWSCSMFNCSFKSWKSHL